MCSTVVTAIGYAAQRHTVNEQMKHLQSCHMRGEQCALIVQSASISLLNAYGLLHLFVSSNITVPSSVANFFK